MPINGKDKGAATLKLATYLGPHVIHEEGNVASLSRDIKFQDK
jgi:hypothetical protein